MWSRDAQQYTPEEAVNTTYVTRSEVIYFDVFDVKNGWDSCLTFPVEWLTYLLPSMMISDYIKDDSFAKCRLAEVTKRGSSQM